ncbi:hypothetical protein B0T19DRAFT_463997 [Cercophora scortea]|uniref:Uncharacterized protein n=1 Tax=Cercophora scortea TaxID=314031 RepID=A0AAE0MA29_9PEZI|nr:hypothetical protein B0T19DRAFT_463997 [Cercophora scortea]
MQSAADWSAAMVRKYWAPACQYTTPEVATHWRSFIRREKFAAWKRAVETEAARYPSSHPTGEQSKSARPQRNGGQAMAITLPWSGEIIVARVLAKDSDLSNMGHDLAAGSHIFRVSQDLKTMPIPGCLQYEGQIPRPGCDYLHRFKTRVLPDVVDSVVSLLSFRPMAGNAQRIPAQLRRIRNKRGGIDQDDLALLLRIWQCKFTDCRDDGTPIHTLHHTMSAILNNNSNSNTDSHATNSTSTYAEAAWLIYQLRRSPEHHQQPFEWHWLIDLLQYASGQRFIALLRTHQKNMEAEGLQALQLDPDSVVVYCSADDVHGGRPGTRRSIRNAAEMCWTGASQAAASSLAPHGPARDPSHGSQWRAAAKLLYVDPAQSSFFHQIYQRSEELVDHHRRADHPAPRSDSEQPQPQPRIRPRPPPPSSSQQLPTPPPSRRSSSSSDRNNVSSSSTRSSTSTRRRPTIGDRGVAVPKGRVAKRRSSSSKPKQLSIEKLFFD